MLVEPGILIFCFFAGGIPVGLIVARIAGIGDVRSQGSGNIGTANMFRVGGPWPGIATFFLDVAKGVAGPWLALNYSDQAWMPALAVAASVAGHCYSPFLKFSGGKGVATFLGGLLAVNGIAAGVFAVLWICLALVFRYSSVSSLAASVAGTAVTVAHEPTGLPILIAPVIIFLAHRGNIERLRAGNERKLSVRRRTSDK